MTSAAQKTNNDGVSGSSSDDEQQYLTVIMAGEEYGVLSPVGNDHFFAPVVASSAYTFLSVEPK